MAMRGETLDRRDDDASLSFAEAGAETLATMLARRRAAVELVTLIVLIEVIMWIVPLTPDPRLYYGVFAALIALLLLVSHIRGGVSNRALGLRFDNFFSTLKSLFIPIAAFVLLMILIGIEFGTLRIGKKFFSMLLFVPVWALLQQYMLLGFAGPRLKLLLRSDSSSLIVTAALFSLLHLPNPVLTIACAVGGYIWARVYRRQPNLFANAITHAVASAFLANSLPGWLLKNMVVGYTYFLR